MSKAKLFLTSYFVFQFCSKQRTQEKGKQDDVEVKMMSTKGRHFAVAWFH